MTYIEKEYKFFRMAYRDTLRLKATDFIFEGEVGNYSKYFINCEFDNVDRGCVDCRFKQRTDDLCGQITKLLHETDYLAYMIRLEQMLDTLIERINNAEVISDV